MEGEKPKKSNEHPNSPNMYKVTLKIMTVDYYSFAFKTWKLSNAFDAISDETKGKTSVELKDKLLNWKTEEKSPISK